MDPLNLIQAVFAGFCYYAGITHMVIGLRSRPRNKVQHVGLASYAKPPAGAGANC